MTQLPETIICSSDILPITSPNHKSNKKVQEHFIDHEAATAWLASALINVYSPPRYCVIKEPKNFINSTNGKGTLVDVGVHDTSRNSYALFEVSSNKSPYLTLNQTLTSRHKTTQWDMAMDVIKPNERYAYAPWPLLSVGLDWFINLTDRMLNGEIDNKQIKDEVENYLENYNRFKKMWNKE